MKELGLSFECHTSGYEENMEAFEDPCKLAIYLATGKAEFIAPKFLNSIIIGADTFVTNGKTKVGKAKNVKEAKQIIHAMSGKTIQVHSGVAVIKTDAEGQIQKKITTHVVTKLKIKKMTPQEIAHLANQEEALQTSGAFSIEGEGGKMIEKIDGDYNNVIGLPLFKLKKMLKKITIRKAQ